MTSRYWMSRSSMRIFSWLTRQAAVTSRRVHGPGLEGQVLHEVQPVVRVGVLISHGPEDHACPVEIPLDQLAELVFRIRIGRWILEIDGPVHGDLFPEQESLRVGHLCSQLMMRVMGQAQEVA